MKGGRSQAVPSPDSGVAADPGARARNRSRHGPSVRSRPGRRSDGGNGSSHGTDLYLGETRSRTGEARCAARTEQDGREFVSSPASGGSRMRRSAAEGAARWLIGQPHFRRVWDGTVAADPVAGGARSTRCANTGPRRNSSLGGRVLARTVTTWPETGSVALRALHPCAGDVMASHVECLCSSGSRCRCVGRSAAAVGAPRAEFTDVPRHGRRPGARAHGRVQRPGGRMGCRHPRVGRDAEEIHDAVAAVATESTTGRTRAARDGRAGSRENGRPAIGAIGFGGPRHASAGGFPSVGENDRLHQACGGVNISRSTRQQMMWPSVMWPSWIFGVSVDGTRTQ